MKWVKIAALILLTLAAMRAGSWTLGWLFSKLPRANRTVVAVASNAAALAAFIVLLVAALMPGEPLDGAAILFGIVVFILCAITDLYWQPWKQRPMR